MKIHESFHLSAWNAVTSWMFCRVNRQQFLAVSADRGPQPSYIALPPDGARGTVGLSQVTMKSSMRPRLPSTFSPFCTNRNCHRSTWCKRRQPAAPTDATHDERHQQVCCRFRRSSILVEYLSRRFEWQDAHLDWKYAWPALASPTTTVGGRMRPGSRLLILNS